MYELIDTLCDSVNPLLLAANFWLMARFWSKGERSLAVVMLAILAIGLAVTYALYFVDRALAIWPSLGADYSTHTSFALAVALPLAGCWRRVRWWLMGLLLVYAVLMVYQGYHSLFDIASSAVVFALFTAPLAGAVLKRTGGLAPARSRP